MNKKAFTLLELLVVILIIGILAAIALPKYQLARDKAEFAKYQAMVSSLRNAYNEYFLTHGQGTSKFDDLFLTMPSDFTQVYKDSYLRCVQNSNMFCCMSKSTDYRYGSINCGKNDLSVIYSITLLDLNNTPVEGRGLCLSEVDNTRANRLCNAIGTKGNKGNTWTPEGPSPVNSYQVYYLN